MILTQRELVTWIFLNNRQIGKVLSRGGLVNDSFSQKKTAHILRGGIRTRHWYFTIYSHTLLW